MVYRSVDVARDIISFVNTASKADFQDLGVTGTSTIIIMSEKSLASIIKAKMSKTKLMLSLKRSQISKVGLLSYSKKVSLLFGIMVNIYSAQETYQALLSQQMNEDSKFKELEKHLKGQVIVEKLGNEFDLLVLKSLPPLPYAQYIEVEVLTKEMLSYNIQ